MGYRYIHTNFNVFDLDQSLRFYAEALGLVEKRRKVHPEGKFILVYLGNDKNEFELELTWLADRTEPYNLGDEEFHICFRTDDYNAAYQKHREMGCIAYENLEMGLYFIKDPDGYWIEIVPER